MGRVSPQPRAATAGGCSCWRVTKPGRARAALTPGEKPANAEPTGKSQPRGSAKLGPPRPPQGPAATGWVPCPPAAHPARLRPAPRMRSVPPLKGQRIPAWSSASRIHLSAQVVSRMLRAFALFSPLSLRVQQSRCGVAEDVFSGPQRAHIPGRFLAGKEFPRLRIS